MKNLETWKEEFDSDIAYCKEHFNCVHRKSEDVRAFIDSLLTAQATEMIEKLDYKLIDMYANLMQFAHSNNQVAGEKNNYYVTLEHLERSLQDLIKDLKTNQPQ